MEKRLLPEYRDEFKKLIEELSFKNIYIGKGEFNYRSMFPFG